MKYFKIIFIVIMALGIINAQADAKSPVWKISKSGNHLFLGGTIHLLTNADYPLPTAFETAYKNSRILVLETDIQKFDSPEFEPTILNSSMYEGDVTIEQFLKPDILLKLKKHLAERNIPIEFFSKFKPGMLSMTLTVIELKRLGLVGTGVDKFFHLKAINDSKDIKYLETAYEQLTFLSEIADGNENELIEYTLDDMKNIPLLLGDLKKAWKSGDNHRLKEVGMDPWVGRFPQLYNALLVDRNNDWIPKIEEMMKTKEVEFILFGALHLVGEEGVLAQLKARGYSVENL